MRQKITINLCSSHTSSDGVPVLPTLLPNAATWCPNATMTVSCYPDASPTCEKKKKNQCKKVKQ